jgi:tetratricopeptide (TPR) repeat protein
MKGLMFAWVCSIAAAAWGRGPDVEGIRSYDLPAYTLVTTDPAAAQAATRATAQADAILGKLIGRADAGRNAPTFLVIVRKPIWARYLAPGSRIYGQFVPGPFANYVEVSIEGGNLEQAVIHEYAHYFLHTQFSGYVPLWFDEGIAQLVAATTVKGEMATLGEVRRTQVYTPDLGGWWPRNASWMPTVTLLGLQGNSRIYRDNDRSYTVHWQSLLLVHRGLAADPAHFGQQLYALLDAQNELVTPEIAIRKSFAMSPAEFDGLVRGYSKGEFATRDLVVGPVTVPRLPPGRDLSALDALDLLAGMMMVSGYNADRFGEILEAMQRAQPGSPVARAWRMRQAARQGDGAALEQLVHGLRTGSDARLLRGAGLALFERALAAKADARPDKAFALLDLAISARPDDAEAVWAFATLAAGLKRDLPVAQGRVEAMRALWPANADLAMAATQVYEALGEKEKARDALQATRKLAKRPEMIRWAKQKLEQDGWQ